MSAGAVRAVIIYHMRAVGVHDAEVTKGVVAVVVTGAQGNTRDLSE
jgi:hypothetical protein